MMRWRSTSGPISVDQFVVVFMCANPDPFVAAADFVSQGAVMVAHADGKPFTLTGKLFEIKRRMMWVVAPEPIVFHGQPLNVFGQLLIELPKPARGAGGHCFSAGQSWSEPAARSASASWNRKSSLPAVASLSICRFQSSW